MKCCQLIEQRQLAAECRVFGDNSGTELHKLCCGIWHNLPQKNGGPANQRHQSTDKKPKEMVTRPVMQNSPDTHGKLWWKRFEVPKVMFAEKLVGGKQFHALGQLDALLLRHRLIVHRLVNFQFLPLQHTVIHC